MIKRSDTLRDQAYELIRDKIIRQELKSGERLSIADLSREFQISNSPIREAIALLVTEGLVISIPNHGFRIVEIDDETFSEIAQSIHVLLTGCYEELFLKGMTKDLAVLLRERLAIQEAFQNPEPVFEYACCTIDFDRAFVDLCHNSMLSKMFDSKFNLLVLCTLQVYTRSRDEVTENLAQHRAILHAVEQNDHDLVRTLLSLHYDKHKPEGI